jgi:HPt (histidine-containing phosphotransfer) domain-containing protein
MPKTTTRSSSQQQQQRTKHRLFQEDKTLTFDEIHTFLRNKEYDSGLDVAHFFFSHKNYSNDKILSFLNDEQIRDTWKLLFFNSLLRYKTYDDELEQSVVSKLTDDEIRYKIYEKIIKENISSNLILARTLLNKIPKTYEDKSELEKSIKQQEEFIRKKTSRLTSGKPIQKQQISTRIQQRDPTLTLRQIYDFLKLNKQTPDKCVLRIFSSSVNKKLFTEDGVDEVVVTFLNDEDMKDKWKWKEYLFVYFVIFLNIANFSKIEKYSRLRKLVERVTSVTLKKDFYKQIIKECIFDDELDTARELLNTYFSEDQDYLNQIEGKIARKEKKIKVKQKGKGSKTVVQQHRSIEHKHSKTNSGSTGLLGLGAVAVGVFMVVLLGVRYRK